ncbi:branched-chain amino acid transport system II carrier protein [Staphylococcus auricularis]|uniref:branched-chain amino acid transport system II carrier protein n=1 Tax=Staphylococcus auricularis TaxID=29379 RepID=UPI001CD96402
MGGRSGKRGFRDGSEMLRYNCVGVLGSLGKLMLGVMVMVGWLRSCIGLVKGCGGLGVKKIGKLSYKWLVLIL